MDLPSGIVALTDEQIDLLKMYASELEAMNARINLVSREDVTHIASRHIPHCLALALRPFADASTVVDWGTGGGLPLIPLAVAFPRVQFVGVDAVAKKIQAVRHFARRLGLTNVDAWHGRAESFDGAADYSVSRATAPIATLWHWHTRVSRPHDVEPDHGLAWPYGLICLKGGELDEEIAELPGATSVSRHSVASLFHDEYFATKEIVCVTAASG